MQLIILGEISSQLASDFANHIESKGHQALCLNVEGRWERETRRADAVIDFAVLDETKKLRQVEAFDRWLPKGKPLFTCTHAISATRVAGVCRRPERVVGFSLVPPWGDRKQIETALAWQCDPCGHPPPPKPSVPPSTLGQPG